MGICYGKNIPSVQEENPNPNPNSNTDSAVDPPNPNPSSNPVPLQNPNTNTNTNTGQNGNYVSNPSPNPYSKTEKKQKPPPSPWRNSPYRFSPFRSPFRSSVPASPATGTPAHLLKRPFPPPSPAKHIQEALRRRFRTPKPKGDPILEDEETKPLNKSFGYPKSFNTKYEIGQEVGRGHFGHTCIAKIKKGDHKGESVAVKVISKAKMTTPISIEDVKREVKILKALTGYKHLCKFYDVCEDAANVYIVMELCEGGELLDRILARGGKYSEEDAKAVVVQILNVVAFCHLQGVVHRDLKPENFLFVTKDEDSPLKAIDFGLSDFVRPDEKLNDIVGSAYYVAPEVLHRSYSMEADVWSVGVITYILLCGSRPFWARTESGIFRSVLKTAPSFEEQPWPSVSPEAKDFVQKLLNKDRHKRMTAAQALAHPWLRGKENVPLDISIYKMVKSYLRSSFLRRAALKAVARQLTEDELYYLRTQYAHLDPSSNGRLTLDNFRNALVKHSTSAMKDSRMMDIVATMEVSHFKKMEFDEFCAAAINVSQLESLPNWEKQSRAAYQNFDQEGNRVVVIEDLARELGIPQSVPAHVILYDWIRHTDGKLSFYGFTCLVRGMPPRSGPKAALHGK